MFSWPGSPDTRKNIAKHNGQTVECSHQSHCFYVILQVDQSQNLYQTSAPKFWSYSASKSWPNLSLKVLKKHCQRHNRPKGWVHITRSYTNLDKISISESRTSINFKISTKLQNLDWTSTLRSWPNLVLKVRGGIFQCRHCQRQCKIFVQRCKFLHCLCFYH